jgi:hypothetical protein
VKVAAIVWFCGVDAACTVTLVVRVVSVPTSIISPSKAGLGKVMVHVVGAVPVHINVELACVAARV